MTPSAEFQSDLVELIDQALVESFSTDQHVGFLGLSFFRDSAQWRLEENAGTAVLTENSITHGGYPISRWPDYNELTLITPQDNDLHHLVRFRIENPKKKIDVLVHETILDSNWTIGMAKFALAARKERKLGLAEPSFEQMDQLIQELERGASGQHQI